VHGKVWPAVAALLAAIGTAGAAVLHEVQSAHPDRWGLGFTIVLGATAVFLGGLKTAQAKAEDDEKDRVEGPADIVGCLYVIHELVRAAKRVTAPPDGWLRIAVHRVAGDALEQSIDYVGSADGGAGTSSPITSGLIGRVARTGDGRTLDRPADAAFENCARYLVDEFAMTAALADGVRKDRYAYMAVPIESPSGRVRAVVYLDAGVPGFFDERTRMLVVEACEGLARFVDARYFRKG
jgi:hypothetical protein